MENSLVSIVIPIYNVELFVRECVNSVITQTYTNIELLLVDDGTPDGCAEISDEYCLCDERIVTIHKTNGGLSSARNTGMDAATGEYLYFLDSDDYIKPETVDTLQTELASDKYDFCFFDGQLVFTGCPFDPDVYAYKRQKDYGGKECHSMMSELLANNEYRPEVPLYFFRRWFLREHSIWFVDGIIHEDEAFSAAAFLLGGKCKHCANRLYIRRIRSNSIMTGGSETQGFLGMAAVYHYLEKLKKRSGIDADTWQAVMVRTTKNVISKYSKLNDYDKSRYHQAFEQVKRNVRINRYYHDRKLQIKCSQVPFTYLYRIHEKLMRMLST